MQVILWFILSELREQWVTFWKTILSLFGEIEANLAGEGGVSVVGGWLENGMPTNLI